MCLLYLLHYCCIGLLMLSWLPVYCVFRVQEVPLVPLVDKARWDPRAVKESLEPLDHREDLDQP